MNRKRVKIAIVAAGFIFIAVSFLHAQETQTPQRVLHFPADYSLGTVCIEDETIEHRIQTTLVHIDGSDWKYLAVAKGDVVVPAGQRVKLILTGQIWEDRKCSADLERLGPDDIYTLVLSAAWIPPGKGKLMMDVCMPHIASLTGLRELMLDQTQLSAMSLKPLASLTNLKILGAPDNLTNGGLGEIVKIKSIKALHISDNQLTDKSLLLLQQLPQLKELSLLCTKFTDQSLEYVAQLPCLTYLHLSGPFSNAAMVHLGKSTSLKILRIYTPDFNDEGMRHISQIPQLERLDAHWMDKITNQGVSCFANHKNLKMLDVMNAKLSDQVMASLLKMPQLETLELPNVGFTDEGVEKLSRLKNLKSLWVSAAGNSPLTDRSLRAVSQLSGLEKITIGGTAITDEGIAQLCRLNLRELSLFEIGITDRGMGAIGRLKSLKRVSIVPKEQITFEGMNYLNQLPCLKHIQIHKVKKGGHVLNLSGLKGLESLQLCMETIVDKKLHKPVAISFLEDEDAACLAGLDQLNLLSISGTKIGDSGFETIAGLKSLQILYLIGPTQITDKGLEAIKQSSLLSRMSIDQGHFTAVGLKAFENREGMDSLELTSDTAFDSKVVAEFKKHSKIQKIKLKP